MFSVGDKVMIRPSSIYYGGDTIYNPANKVGEIVSISKIDGVIEDHGIQVMWDWDRAISNLYDVDDLMHQNKETRRREGSNLVFRFVV